MKANRHTPHQLFCQAVLPALLLAATAQSTWAQDSSAAATPRVEVVAPRIEPLAPRVDARSLCPELDAAMLSALSQVAMREREPGALDVSFTIAGRQIDEVAIAGRPFAYRRATRSAVRALACDNGNAGVQSVRLQVVFKDL